MLFGVSPRDPATLIGVSVFLLTFGVSAEAVSDWRASRTDPLLALRSD